jgi:hypothetical protein
MSDLVTQEEEINSSEIYLRNQTQQLYILSSNILLQVLTTESSGQPFLKCEHTAKN